jgi:hypothetical protein
MLKQLMALLTLFATVNTYATVGNGTLLTNAFDELSYKLEVEWDQKDKEFYKNTVQSFQETVKGLQAKGLSNSELFDIAKNQIKDEKIKKDFELALLQINLNQLNDKEARKFLLDSMSKSYREGANYSGGSLLYGAIAVVFIAAIIAAAASGGTVYYDPGCYEEYVCYDYYDDWGFYWYTDCFYETYCY